MPRPVNRRSPERARARLFTLALLVVTAGALPAVAAEDALRVELNKLEDQDGGCRIHLVLDNQTPSAFEGYKLDLVLFAPDGVIARRLAVETAPLRPRKMSVKLFDVAGLACAGIGSVLVNDVVACRSDATDRTDCIDTLSVGSRAAVALTK